MKGGLCNRLSGKVRSCLNGGILCSALSLRCLGRWRQKLNDVGFLKGDSVLLRKSGNLESRIHTKIGVDIDPMEGAHLTRNQKVDSKLEIRGS